MSIFHLTRKVRPVQVTGASHDTAAITDSSSTALTAATPTGTDPGRRMLIIENKGSAAVYYRIDGTAATVATGRKLLPGDSHEYFDAVPQEAITAICDTGDTSTLLLVTG